MVAQRARSAGHAGLSDVHPDAPCLSRPTLSHEAERLADRVAVDSHAIATARIVRPALQLTDDDLA